MLVDWLPPSPDHLYSQHRRTHAHTVGPAQAQVDVANSVNACNHKLLK